MKKPVLWSIAFYLAACALPALVFHVGDGISRDGSLWSGYRTERGVNLLGQGLLFGWVRMNFTAFANLPLWFSGILFARRHYPAARAFAIAALILSIETLQLIFQPMIWDEGASDKGFLVAPHIGYVLWIASMVVIYRASHLAGKKLSPIS